MRCTRPLPNSFPLPCIGRVLTRSPRITMMWPPLPRPSSNEHPCLANHRLNSDAVTRELYKQISLLSTYKLHYRMDASSTHRSQSGRRGIQRGRFGGGSPPPSITAAAIRQRPGRRALRTARVPVSFVVLVGAGDLAVFDDEPTKLGQSPVRCTESVRPMGAKKGCCRPCPPQ